MKIIKINGKDYNLKTSFSELTREEILKVAHVRSSQMVGAELSQEEFHAMRIVLFTICTNVPWKITNAISNVEWVDILPHLNWCFEVPNFEGNPILRFRRWLTVYVGPFGKLSPSTIEEMTNADNVFVKASNQKDPESLYLLAAILWRPVRSDLQQFRASEHWNGDVREPFNMNHCKERVPAFKKMPLHFIVYIFLYYWDFRENRLMKFKRVFEGGKSSGTNRGWAGTLLEISHLPVFGNIDQIKHQNWYTVLFEMDRQLELSIKREEDAIRKNFKK